MDISFLLALQDFRNVTNDIFTSFFSKITLLGEGYLPYLFLLFLFWCVDRDFGRRAMMGVGTGRFVNGLVKITACVYRPWIRSAEIIPASGSYPTGYSFPSGHTTAATLSFGYAGWHYRRGSRLLSFILCSLVALVMFSRLYLGVHTPQDVLTGCALTCLTLILTGKLVSWMEAGKNRDFAVLAGTVLVIILGIIYAMTKHYPIDYDEVGQLIVDPATMRLDFYTEMGRLLGCVMGLVLEGRLVRFSTDIPFAKKLVRFAVGALLYSFLFATGRPVATLIFASKNTAYFVSAAVPLFFAVGLYPMMFKLFEKKKESHKSKMAG